VNKSTPKDLIEPFVTASVPFWRRLQPQTLCIGIGQEIAHAKLEKFLETHEIATALGRTAFQEDFTQSIDIAACYYARAGVGTVVTGVRMSFGVLSPNKRP
jgi:hypothetical protein